MMTETDNFNSGKDWSEMDLWDLESYLRMGASIEEIARFMCRDVDEVRQKADEIQV